MSVELISCLFRNSQNYCPRCRGQLDALLPEAGERRQYNIDVYHGSEGSSFDYSTQTAMR